MISFEMRHIVRFCILYFISPPPLTSPDPVKLNFHSITSKKLNQIPIQYEKMKNCWVVCRTILGLLLLLIILSEIYVLKKERWRGSE